MSLLKEKRLHLRGKQEVFELKGMIMNCRELALNKIKKNPFDGFFFITLGSMWKLLFFDA